MLGLIHQAKLPTIVVLNSSTAANLIRFGFRADFCSTHITLERDPNLCTASDYLLRWAGELTLRTIIGDLIVGVPFGVVASLSRKFILCSSDIHSFVRRMSRPEGKMHSIQSRSAPTLSADPSIRRTRKYGPSTLYATAPTPDTPDKYNNITLQYTCPSHHSAYPLE